MAPHAVLLFLTSLALAGGLSLSLPSGTRAQTEEFVGTTDDECEDKTNAGEEDRGAGEEDIATTLLP